MNSQKYVSNLFNTYVNTGLYLISDSITNTLNKNLSTICPLPYALYFIAVILHELKVIRAKSLLPGWFQWFGTLELILYGWASSSLSHNSSPKREKAQSYAQAWYQARVTPMHYPL